MATGDLITTNLLVGSSLDDTSPVHVTKEGSFGALAIDNLLLMNYGDSTLSTLPSNAAVPAFLVNQAVSAINNTDAGTLSTLQQIQAEFASGGDVAVAIANIAANSSTINAIQSDVNNVKSDVTSLQSTVSSQASSISSITTAQTNVVKIDIPQTGNVGTVSIGSGGQSLTWAVRWRP